LPVNRINIFSEFFKIHCPSLSILLFKQ
jgi:hypothetical protein